MSNPSNQLLLVSNSEFDIELRLAKNVSVKAGTHRRDAVRPVPLNIKAGGHIELTSYLGVSKQEAIEIVLDSIDYQAMVAKNPHVLRLVDVDEEIANHIAGSTIGTSQPERPASRPIAVIPELPVETDRSEGVEQRGLKPVTTAEVQLEIMGPLFAPKFTSLGSVPSTQAPVESDEIVTQPEVTGGLEPGMRASLADNMPSTRWSREKLLEYAKGRGIEIQDGMSKNAILRKLRG